VELPYEKYRLEEQELWRKFKENVRDKCKHPVEHVTSVRSCDEDGYGMMIYNRGITVFKCKYCGGSWHEEWHN
jgi:hypothetical protein